MNVLEHTYGGTEICPPCTEQATIACACLKDPNFKPTFPRRLDTPKAPR